MKLIGITGSCGKTSIVEILYQYLLYKGVKVSAYCSNGLFINGLTRKKDFFQGTLYFDDLDKYLKEDADNDVEVAIIEINAESVKRSDKVHLMNFDVVALSSYYDGISNNYDNKYEYLETKRTILLNSSASKILLRMEDDNYKLFSDINHITYGYTNKAKHCIEPLSNDINGISMRYKGVEFHSNLISGYHIRNMCCALAVLEEVGFLDMSEFKIFAENINIRGRFEKVNCNGKNIIIDTGYSGALTVLSALEVTLKGTNYKVIYSNIHHKEVNDWVRNSRRKNGRYLQKSKHIYLTSHGHIDSELDIFVNDCIDKDFSNYEYISNPENCCITALNNLEIGETLIIFSRDYYREYRQYILKSVQE